MSILLFWPFLLLISLLTYADLKAGILPYEYNYVLLWLGLLVNPLLAWVPLYSAILGVVSGYLILLGVYLLFKWHTHNEGLGFGDFKLLAALLAWFGYSAIPTLLCLDSLSTLFVLGMLKLWRRYPVNQHIPFGPGLCFAGLILYFSKSLTLF